MYSWCTQTLKAVMQLLQCNVVKQMLDLLQGLVPQQVQEETSAAKSVSGDIDQGIPLSKFYLKPVMKFIDI